MYVLSIISPFVSRHNSLTSGLHSSQDVSDIVVGRAGSSSRCCRRCSPSSPRSRSRGKCKGRLGRRARWPSRSVPSPGALSVRGICAASLPMYLPPAHGCCLSSSAASPPLTAFVLLLCRRLADGAGAASERLRQAPALARRPAGRLPRRRYPGAAGDDGGLHDTFARGLEGGRGERGGEAAAAGGHEDGPTGVHAAAGGPEQPLPRLPCEHRPLKPRGLSE